VVTVALSDASKLPIALELSTCLLKTILLQVVNRT
jgi:hypothetical protein